MAGAHAKPTVWDRLPTRWKHRLSVAGGIGVLFLGIWTSAVVAVPAPPPPVAVAAPVSELEANYLRELEYAGIKLDDREKAAAVEIARTHVAHGHLVGMRLHILNDFHSRFPRLSEQELDAARMAVEHHFQAVTGRKQ